MSHLWNWNVHATFQVNMAVIGDVTPKVLSGTALFVFLELQLVEQ